MGEIIFLTALLMICALFYMISFDFAVNILDTSGGAGMFPRIVIIFTAILLVIRIYQVIKEKNNSKFEFLGLFKGLSGFFFLNFLIYVVLLNSIGYLIMTTLFLISTINVFYIHTKGDFGSLKSVIIRNVLAIVFVLSMNYFFVELLNIMLPVGIFGLF